MRLLQSSSGAEAGRPLIRDADTAMLASCGTTVYRSAPIPETVHMNNAELAETLVASHAMSKADARKAVDDVMAAIVTAVSKGDEVSLAGFGKFKVKDSPAREGRNPSTGEAIQIAASRKLTFAPAKAVKDALNG